jgi:plastocyanin
MFVSVIALLTVHIAPLALSASNSPRVVELTAKQFAFEPESIRVNIGEEVLFKVTSQDITHGFYIDGYDIFVDILPGETVEVGPIKFDKPGKFKIRCATLCGPLHPFMVADIIVEPNIPFYTILFGAIIVGGAFLLFIKRRGDKMSSENGSSWEIDLLKMKTIGPLLKKVLQWRGVHFFLILPNLLIFVIVLMTGFFGNPLGALNFSIAVVWILWFAAVEFMILFASRIWCCVCPMPAFGEWLARRRLCTVHEPRKWFSLRRRWPKSLNNIWVASLGFLSISLFVPWLVTRPFISGLLFIILIALAFVLHLIFAERYFCLHICPASGYIGYHSASSMLAVRSRDRKICDEHMAKECVRGSPKGYGCPWKRYPGGNDWNAYCGLCFECLKSCPLDNMTLKFRALDKDILKRVRTRIDEAWMGFIRFTLALFYIVVFFGPYFWIKDWGNMGVNFGANLLTAHLLIPTFQGFKNWLGWAVIVSSVSLLIFPAVFFVFSWLAKKAANHPEVSAKQVFLAFSYSLSSYGHFLWIAFAISLLAVNWAYPLRAFSDPFGWGWNLIGTGDIAWRPFMPHLLPYIQAPIVFLGLGFALMATYHIGLNLFKDKRKAFRASVVMGILHTLVALLFVYIVMG